MKAFSWVCFHKNRCNQRNLININHRFDTSSIVLESGKNYTFEVNATDYVGNKARPSTWTWHTGKINSSSGTKFIIIYSLK